MQIEWEGETKGLVWQSIVKSKIRNHDRRLAKIGQGERAAMLDAFAEEVMVGDLIGTKIELDQYPIISLVIEEPSTYFQISSLAYAGFRGERDLFS